MSREVLTDLAVLERLVEINGRDVVDVGCGGGALVRALSARGARMTGVEISAEQLATAMENDGGGRAQYLVGRAESLPLERASVDAVMFMRSLHHVPPAAQPEALREARRVLRPGGIVYVAEPLAEGDFFELILLVEDEREVRAAAQRAVEGCTDVGLERAVTFEYDVRQCVPDLAALRARVVSVDPSRGACFDAHRAEIAEAFGRLGEDGERPGERCFRQPMRVDVLRLADG